MTLFETIFSRRSVRKYDMTPLDTETIEQLKNHLDGIKQLDNQYAEFKFVDDGQVGDKKPTHKSAPHYIFTYCDENPHAYINVGYTLQKMDLYLQSIGLGSLWLGLSEPKEKSDKDRFCIMLAFGKTDVPVRTAETDFKRLEINEVSNEDNSVARAARLAPSAMNSQPWKFDFSDSSLKIDYRNIGVLKAVLKSKLSQIDMGIVTAVSEIALTESGKQVTKIDIVNTKNKYGTVISF